MRTHLRFESPTLCPEGLVHRSACSPQLTKAWQRVLFILFSARYSGGLCYLLFLCFFLSIWALLCLPTPTSSPSLLNSSKEKKKLQWTCIKNFLIFFFLLFFLSLPCHSFPENTTIKQVGQSKVGTCSRGLEAGSSWWPREERQSLSRRTRVVLWAIWVHASWETYVQKKKFNLFRHSENANMREEGKIMAESTKAQGSPEQHDNGDYLWRKWC